MVAEYIDETEERTTRYTREQVLRHAPDVESRAEADIIAGTAWGGRVDGGQVEAIPRSWWLFLEPREGLRAYLLGRLEAIQDGTNRHTDALDQVDVYRFILKAIDDGGLPWTASMVLPDGILMAAAIRFDCSERTVQRAIEWCEDRLAAMRITFS